jgi:hypothetical protein
MNLEFVQKLRNISQRELDFAEEAAFYLTVAASVYFVLFGNVLSVSNMVGDILKSTVCILSSYLSLILQNETNFHQRTRILFSPHQKPLPRTPYQFRPLRSPRLYLKHFTS